MQNMIFGFFFSALICPILTYFEKKISSALTKFNALDIFFKVRCNTAITVYIVSECIVSKWSMVSVRAGSV